MPSTLELIRFQNSVSKMSTLARTQFLTDTLLWLEQEEHAKVRQNEEADFAVFVKDIQGAKTGGMPDTWYHDMFKKNKNHGYFLRFLQRIR